MPLISYWNYRSINEFLFFELKLKQYPSLMNRFALKHWLLFLAVSSFLLVTFSASAQRYNLSVYNVSNGMPGNQINEIIQDHNGRLWIGTMNGVTVYDG